MDKITRRKFLGLTGAALASIALGAGNPPQADAPTSTPPPPTPPIEPTGTPAPTPSSALTSAADRPDAIEMPEVPSRVVQTHHSGVWQGDTLSPEAVRQMVDASIVKLTDASDANAAWAALFKPTEKISIKVNVFRNSLIWTHLPLVLAVTDSLTQIGVPPENIFIFDYYTDEFKTAGYPINKDGPGVRCYGTVGNVLDDSEFETNYTGGWMIGAVDVKLSNILLNCDALINMPILKSHMLAGFSFALKNHYGSVSRPDSLHSAMGSDGMYLPIGYPMAQLNALPPIKDRTRLIVGDILTANLNLRAGWPYWDSDYVGDSILMSFDPLAHDTIGFQILSDLLKDKSDYLESLKMMATPCFEYAGKLGLGATDPKQIELVELKLA